MSKERKPKVIWRDKDSRIVMVWVVKEGFSNPTGHGQWEYKVEERYTDLMGGECWREREGDYAHYIFRCAAIELDVERRLYREACRMALDYLAAPRRAEREAREKTGGMVGAEELLRDELCRVLEIDPEALAADDPEPIVLTPEEALGSIPAFADAIIEEAESMPQVGGSEATIIEQAEAIKETCERARNMLKGPEPIVLSPEEAREMGAVDLGGGALVKGRCFQCGGVGDVTGPDGQDYTCPMCQGSGQAGPEDEPPECAMS